MFIRGFFVLTTIIIVGFSALLWLPQDLPFRITLIIALITFCAIVVHEIIKFVLDYERQKVRGY